MKEELTGQFKDELANKIELEKSNHQLELSKAINKELLIKEKYNNLKLKLESSKVINKR